MRKRIRYGRKPWRKRWPWKKWFPPVVDERFCPKCGLPHQDGPMPPEVEKFVSGSAGAVAYPAGNWKADQLVFEFGQWKPYQRYHLSEYLLEEHVEDMKTVITRVCDFVAEQKRLRRRA